MGRPRSLSSFLHPSCSSPSLLVCICLLWRLQWGENNTAAEMAMAKKEREKEAEAEGLQLYYTWAGRETHMRGGYPPAADLRGYRRK